MNRSWRVKLKRTAKLANSAFQTKCVITGTTVRVHDEDAVKDALQDAIDKLEAVLENQMTAEFDLREHPPQLYHGMGLIHFNYNDARDFFARNIETLGAVKAAYASRVSQN
jgi:hypothetical protein